MRRLLRSNIIFIFLFLIVSPCSVFAQAKAEAKKPVAVDPDFSYTSKDRRDPFESAVLMRLKQRQTNNASKEGYELEELKLVGVLKSNGAKYAMMEDTQGKGMLFKQGDFVNKTTWITDVDEERVTMAYKIKGDVRKFALDILRK